MTAAAEQEAARLEADLATRLETIRDLAVPSAADVETMIAAVEPVSPEAVTLLRSVLTLFTVAGRRRDAVLGSPPTDVPDEVLPEGVSGSLRETASRFAETATALRAVASDTDRQAAADRLQELQDRRQLARDLPNALLRLDTLKRVQALSACRRACDTGAVSRKNSELRRAFLTADFQRRLAAEFTSLDLEHLPLRLSERSDRGQSLISVALDTELRVPNRQVLSEGKLGALALACFLAEVASVPVQSPIVLDDPVSSLDHVRIERVARRLVSEARSGRQVIIFTHCEPHANARSPGSAGGELTPGTDHLGRRLRSSTVRRQWPGQPNACTETAIEVQSSTPAPVVPTARVKMDSFSASQAVQLARWSFRPVSCSLVAGSPGYPSSGAPPVEPRGAVVTAVCENDP